MCHIHPPVSSESQHTKQSQSNCNNSSLDFMKSSVRAGTFWEVILTNDVNWSSINFRKKATFLLVIPSTSTWFSVPAHWVLVLFVGVHDDFSFSFPLCFSVHFIFPHALSKDGIHPFKGLKPATRLVDSPITEPSKTYSWLRPWRQLGTFNHATRVTNKTAQSNSGKVAIGGAVS